MVLDSKEEFTFSSEEDCISDEWLLSEERIEDITSYEYVQSYLFLYSDHVNEFSDYIFYSLWQFIATWTFHKHQYIETPTLCSIHLIGRSVVHYIETVSIPRFVRSNNKSIAGEKI